MRESEKAPSDRPEPRVHADDPALFAAELGDLAPLFSNKLETTPEDVERSVAKLVLTLVELIRRVMEHQAVRRMEGGGLDDDEVERLGVALMRLQERLEEVKNAFGLEGEDLNIDLGPLGRLL